MTSPIQARRSRNGPAPRKSASAADPAALPSPLTADEFAAALDRIGGFEEQPLIAVAVSGGPDSMALGLLAHDWAARRGGAAWMLTVDHGLRPESAEEARTVASWFAARGIPHEILEWTGAKPKTGVQAAARDARYRLLAGWCRGRGCLHLLTAHHREDQVETHLIRRRAGSAVEGLAGMSGIRELEGCRLLRPLLPVPRARLAALLAAEGQAFLSDPSNENQAFERARLRRGPLLGDPERVHAAFEAARENGRTRALRELALSRVLAETAALHPAGFASLDIAALAGFDPDLGQRVLARLAAAVGGGRYPARRDRVARLHVALRAAPQRAQTLGGCRFVPWRRRLLVLRELAAAEGPAHLRPGDLSLWDRRFDAEVPAEADRAFTLRYLGSGDIAALRRSEMQGTGDLPRFVYPVLPAFWDEHGLAAVPALGYRRDPGMILPTIRLRPASPLSTAGFTVV